MKCVTNVHPVGLRNQNWHAQNVLGILRQHWDSTQDHSVTSWLRLAAYVWCCRCGARAAKFAKKLGEPCVGHPRSQEYARSIRLLSSGWHPKENRFLGTPKLFTKQAWARWRRSYQGDNCDRAGLAELRQAVIRLRTAEVQPTNPDDKKHLLLKTGEIKCGARVERDSAPRLLLKTACSGAPRTKEYERALSLLGKGQHPKSSVFVGLPSPISDKEWDQWHQDHGSLFFLSARVVQFLSLPRVTPRARTASREKEEDKKHTGTV